MNRAEVMVRLLDMKLNKYIRYFIHCLAFVVICGASVTFTKANPLIPKCFVSGKILSPTEAVIPYVTVSLSSEDKLGEKFSGISDDLGQYKIEVSSGSYNVSLSKKFQEELFVDYRRSEIVVTCKTNIEINIYPWSEISRKYKGNIIPAFQYDSFRIKKGKDFLPKVTISYVTYNKTLEANIYKNVVLSFNIYTIKAQSITVDKKTNLFTAFSGWFEDGSRRRNFSKLVFSVEHNNYSTLQILESIE